MIHIFHFFNVDFFVGHCLSGTFQTWHNYNLARGLQIYTRFDDHALRCFKVRGLSETQTANCVFQILVQCCKCYIVATDIKQIMDSML